MDPLTASPFYSMLVKFEPKHKSFIDIWSSDSLWLFTRECIQIQVVMLLKLCVVL
jgi:hypothetical protein